MSSSNVPRQEIFSKFKEIIRELDWRKTLADEDIKARLRGALPGISDADFNNILVHHTTVVPADAPYTVTIKFKPKIDTAPEPVIFVGTSGERLLHLKFGSKRLLRPTTGPPVGDHESTGYIAIISEEDAAAVKEFTVVHDPVTDPSLGIEFSADNTIYATVSLHCIDSIPVTDSPSP